MLHLEATPELHLYAGIGSRETPVEVCLSMTELARQLSPEWKLRSGHAQGADQAFERGADAKEIHLPFREYNNAPISRGYFHIPRPTVKLCDIAAAHHPKWDSLSDVVKLLMMRNASILLGEEADTPVKMVVCWTPGAREIGGTSHGIRIARSHGIPVFNLARATDFDKLCEFVSSH